MLGVANRLAATGRLGFGRMAERDAYPVWVVMGAACVGTLLGGVAVWFALMGRPDFAASERRDPSAAEDPGAETESSTGGPADGDTGEGTGLDSEQATEDAGVPPDFDPGGSPLVRAIESTRDSVVAIEFGGSVRGAGVVYDDRGLVLTNSHVIEGVAMGRSMFGGDVRQAGITANFPDGRRRLARILAADPDEDIAILQLVPERNEERFAEAPLGLSSALRLGEQVFAIGSPVGFEATVVTGIVSALDRTEVLANRQLPVIQLDAAINFGNSGGPLFNLRGELVGIATARSRRGEGIGFAIPIDRVRLFLRALQEGKGGRSGTVGVVLDIAPEIAELVTPLGFHSGITVSEVDAGAPAKEAGLAVGDVIVALRGRRHDELDPSPRGRARFAQLFGETIRSLLPGEAIAVTVVRPSKTGERGELIELELTVEAANEREQALIDAEELLGLYLDPDVEVPTIRELVPGAPVSAVPGAARALRGATITSLFLEDVDTLAELGAGLERLRGWSGPGGRIAITFTTAQGQPIPLSAYPLSQRP